MSVIDSLVSKARSLFTGPEPSSVPTADPPLPQTVAPAPPRFDPLDDQYVADPYPLLATLREHDPVHRSITGSWLLTRHEDVTSALADPRFSNAPSRYAVVHARNREKYVCADVANRIIPFMDPPQHTFPRKAVGRATADLIRRKLPDLSALALECLPARAGDLPSAEAGVFDVLHDFATPFSGNVLCALFDLPREDVSRLKAWSESFFYLFTAIPSEAVRDELNRALTEFRAYFRELVETRRQAPGEDLISAMLAIEIDGEQLGEDLVVDHCMLLFADGVENVDRCIATTVALLLRHPDQLALLSAEPDRWSDAVDEALRYEGPAQYIGRVAREDITIGDKTIPQHAGVFLMLGSANRDPKVWPNPDAFDIRRTGPQHLSFGKGRHSCIGGPLVRLEVEAAVRTWFDTCSHFALVEPELHWEARAGHRWLQKLPVVAA